MKVPTNNNYNLQTIYIQLVLRVLKDNKSFRFFERRRQTSPRTWRRTTLSLWRFLRTRWARRRDASWRPGRWCGCSRSCTPSWDESVWLSRPPIRRSCNFLETITDCLDFVWSWNDGNCTKDHSVPCTLFLKEDPSSKSTLPFN